MVVERLPRFNLPITNPEPEPKPDTYFVPVSPSVLEYLDKPPTIVVEPEQVVSSLRGDIGHKMDNIFVGQTKWVRAYKSDKLEDLKVIPAASEREFLKWKTSQVFVARPPKTRIKPQVEGLIYPASQVKKIWNDDPSILRLESDIADAHKNALFNKRPGLLSETSPMAETYTEVLKVINANFTEIFPEISFGFQIKLRYDYLCIKDGVIYLFDQKYTLGDPYDKIQVLLYSLCAKAVAADTSILHEVEQQKPINTVVRESDLENVEFYYRLLDPVQRRFYYLKKTLKGAELALAKEEFFEKSRRWKRERFNILPILRERNRAYVKPHIPRGKDFFWPAQMRLL